MTKVYCNDNVEGTLAETVGTFYMLQSCMQGNFQSVFLKKTPTLTVASFFRQFNAIGPLFVHYALLPYVLSTSFSTHPKPLTWDKRLFQSSRVTLSTFFDTMRCNVRQSANRTNFENFVQDVKMCDIEECTRWPT